jgi:multimeric flavodoxin WrbA
MKVLLINGSPHKNGSTYTALNMVEQSLLDNGIETEWFNIGNKPVRGCIDCRKCKDSSRCVFNDDPCNDLIEAIINADGVIVGSPVYFAGPNGALCALLDRVFYAAVERGGQLFRGKPAAAVASCYRAGTTATLDRLNKYFTFSEMPVVSSEYWNMMFQHGSSAEMDAKGHKTLKTLGINMANMLKKLNA